MRRATTEAQDMADALNPVAGRLAQSTKAHKERRGKKTHVLCTLWSPASAGRPEKAVVQMVSSNNAENTSASLLSSGVLLFCVE